MADDLGTKRHPAKARKDRRVTREREGKLGSTAEITQSGLSLEELAHGLPSPRTGTPRTPPVQRPREQRGGGHTAARTEERPVAPAAPPATPQRVPTPATRQMPSLWLISGPKGRSRSEPRTAVREETKPPTAQAASRRVADPYEGKSEATVLLEMLLDTMERMYEAAVESFGVPFGTQETTEAKWRSWFVRDATPGQRREQMAVLGLPEVSRRVFGEQVAQGAG